MAVRIRLARAGAKKVPFYRIVVADQQSSRGGKFIEKIGTFDPQKSEIVINHPRVQHWLSQGAQPSHTVSVLIKRSAKTEAAKEG